jgi:alkylhydroperoxidase family enzyme
VGALDAVEWEACLLEPVRNPDAERRLRKELGMVPAGARYFLGSPWLTSALALLSTARLPMLHVSVDESSIIALVVSQENSCRYCYAATRTALRILGFSEPRIRRLEEDFLSADLTARQKAALEFVRCVARAAPLATVGDARPLLDAGYRADAVKELALLAALNIFYNRLSTMAALPPETMAGMANRWSVRLLRPLIAGYLRRRPAAHPNHLGSEQRQGPFAAFVNAFDGLPVAPRLRTVIDEVWSSAGLGRRIKGLVFAVVARGLGCARSEQEAVRLLRAEGLTQTDLDQALAHLDGPPLDPRERAAASLARESIWYRPAQIQRHAAGIRSLFTAEQFVDLLGTVSAANLLSRLGVAADIAEQPH